ncbi:MAG: hypothetical protein ACRC0L_01565, partial [Angustibacter sp.]
MSYLPAPTASNKKDLKAQSARLAASIQSLQKLRAWNERQRLKLTQDLQVSSDALLRADEELARALAAQGRSAESVALAREAHQRRLVQGRAAAFSLWESYVYGDLNPRVRTDKGFGGRQGQDGPVEWPKTRGGLVILMVDSSGDLSPVEAARATIKLYDYLQNPYLPRPDAGDIQEKVRRFWEKNGPIYGRGSGDRRYPFKSSQAPASMGGFDAGVTLSAWTRDGSEPIPQGAGFVGVVVGISWLRSLRSRQSITKSLKDTKKPLGPVGVVPSAAGLTEEELALAVHILGRHNKSRSMEAVLKAILLAVLVGATTGVAGSLAIGRYTNYLTDTLEQTEALQTIGEALSDEENQNLPVPGTGKTVREVFNEILLAEDGDPNETLQIFVKKHPTTWTKLTEATGPAFTERRQQLSRDQDAVDRETRRQVEIDRAFTKKLTDQINRNETEARNKRDQINAAARKQDVDNREQARIAESEATQNRFDAKETRRKAFEAAFAKRFNAPGVVTIKRNGYEVPVPYWRTIDLRLMTPEEAATKFFKFINEQRDIGITHPALENTPDNIIRQDVIRAVQKERNKPHNKPHLNPPPLPQTPVNPPPRPLTPLDPGVPPAPVQKFDPSDPLNVPFTAEPTLKSRNTITPSPAGDLPAVGLASSIASASSTPPASVEAPADPDTSGAAVALAAPGLFLMTRRRKTPGMGDVSSSADHSSKRNRKRAQSAAARVLRNSGVFPESQINQEAARISREAKGDRQQAISLANRAVQQLDLLTGSAASPSTESGSANSGGTAARSAFLRVVLGSGEVVWVD